MAVTMSEEKKATQRIRVEPSPLCPVHGCPMRVGSVRDGIRYWYCPHTTCHCSKKQSASIVLFVDVPLE